MVVLFTLLDCRWSTVFTGDAQHGDLRGVVERAGVYRRMVVNRLRITGDIFWYWDEALTLHESSGFQRLQGLHHRAAGEVECIIDHN